MEHYKLLITVGGHTVEISSHDRAWVEQKEKEYRKLLLGSESPSVESFRLGKKEVKPTTEGTAKPQKLGKMPVNEFYRTYIHDKKVTSRPDIATFFIYYLTKIQGTEEVSATTVKNLFRDVQYPGWNKININDALNKAKKKAFLNSVGNQWSLTITGEDFVLNRLSKQYGFTGQHPTSRETS